MSRRYDVRALARFIEAGRPEAVVIDRWRKLSKLGHRVVAVPASGTVNVVLGGGPSRVQFLALASSVEGVTWAPVRTAGNTGTRDALEWLDDFTLPATVSQAGNYFHEHSVPSYQGTIDHATDGVRKFYDALPTWFSFKEDHEHAPNTWPFWFTEIILGTSWAEIFAGGSVPASRAAASVGRAASLLTLHDNAVAWFGRNQRLLLGMDRFADMDVADAADEVLSLLVEAFVGGTGSGGAGTLNLTVRLLNYPFTASDLAGPVVGSLTDQGDVVWSQEDVYLCPSASPGGSTPGAYMEATKTVALDNTQKQTTVSFLKSDFAATDGGTLKRVTMMDLYATVDDAATKVTHVVIPAVQFGPVRTLAAAEEIRPFAYRAGTFWTGADVPTIALVNPTTRAARVSVDWGEEA